MGDLTKIPGQRYYDGTHRRENIVRAVLEERDRQDAKWGTDFSGRNHAFWLAILMEEIGEAAQAYLEQEQELLRTELIQSAAVIFSWLEFFNETSVYTDVRA